VYQLSGGPSLKIDLQTWAAIYVHSVLCSSIGLMMIFGNRNIRSWDWRLGPCEGDWQIKLVEQLLVVTGSVWNHGLSCQSKFNISRLLMLISRWTLMSRIDGSPRWEFLTDSTINISSLQIARADNWPHSSSCLISHRRSK
jgi:hypothetical protein